jgi:hypothetical protein
MKTSELRIGNFVNYIEDNIRFSVTGIKQQMISAGNRNENCTLDIEAFEPIPLTEEWLIKLGFSKQTDTSPYNYRIHKSKMFFYIRYGSFTTDGGKTDLNGFNGLFIANKFVRVIKYVHELQNLYFVLTGEELKLK